MSEKEIEDKKILQIAKSFVKGFGPIDKKCFIVSSSLQGYLSFFFKIKTKLVMGEIYLQEADWDHYWLELANGKILDPTAGQFKELKLPKVYLGDLPKSYKKLKSEKI